MGRLGAVGKNRLAVFLGSALPILPVPILWINMISSVAQGLVLAQREPELMSRSPQDTILTAPCCGAF